MTSTKDTMPASATAVTARPEVVATMNAYLQAAAEAVVHEDFDMQILGLMGIARPQKSISDDAHAAMVAQLVAAYVQGAVVLHVAGVGCQASLSQSLEVRP